MTKIIIFWQKTEKYKKVIETIPNLMDLLSCLYTLSLVTQLFLIPVNRIIFAADLEGLGSPSFILNTLMEEIQTLVMKFLTPLLEENGLFLVDLKLNDRSVRVFIDKVEGRITIVECVKVSRGLEKELNEIFDFSAKYSLEVSSPGLDQPFKVPLQYEKYRGREVEVVCDDGQKLTGKLGELNDNKLTLIVEKPKKSNKKQMEEEQVELEFSHIKSTKPYIKF